MLAFSELAPMCRDRATAWCLMLALLLPVMPPRASAIDAKAALDALGFPADTGARVANGRFVEVALPAPSERDLSVGIAFVVAKRAPDDLARTVREEERVLRADRNMIAYGRLDGDGSLEQFEKLMLTPPQTKAYAGAAPGDRVNVSADEISALHAAGHDANAITEQVHALLLRRYRAYRAKGLAGIAAYARPSTVVSPADDIAEVNRVARASKVLATSFYDLLDRYPQHQPPGFAENFYWSQFRAHGEDAIALEHIFQATFDGTVVVVQRHYYVSTGYNAEQAIAGFLTAGDGTLVIYTSHTSTDQVLGFGASAKRTLGRRVMAAELERLFETTRAGLER
jgi:hypothetical protein